MDTTRPHNYLRAQRKRSGLTQREIAFLLGRKHDAIVSRFERRTRVPTLDAAFSLSVIFGVPLDELFPGFQEDLTRIIQIRIDRLLAGVSEATTRAVPLRLTDTKRRWLLETKSRLAVKNFVTPT
jgi:transcriptional regulator with XRE-family HTH domain